MFVSSTYLERQSPFGDIDIVYISYIYTSTLLLEFFTLIILVVIDGHLFERKKSRAYELLVANDFRGVP